MDYLGYSSITGFNNLTVGRYDRVLREIEPALICCGRNTPGTGDSISDTDLLKRFTDQPAQRPVYVVPRRIGLAASRPPAGEVDNYRIYRTRGLPWLMAPRIQVMVDEDRLLELYWRSG